MASKLFAPPPLDGHVGPFPPKVKPVMGRPGMFKRISERTGNRVWAWWDGRGWCKYSSDYDTAKANRGKRSRKQLWWYGRAAR